MRDVYKDITDKVVASIETGTAPWRCPWQTGQSTFLGNPLRHDGTPYRGINVVSLWIDAQDKQLSSPYWLTFNQAKKLGGCVRRGEHGSLSVYANQVQRKTGERDDDGNEERVNIYLMRGYTVFNAAQIDGLPPRYQVEAVEPYENPDARDAAVDDFFNATGSVVEHGGSRAYYRPSTDSIHMPEHCYFERSDAYYSTLAHEHTHWTGAKSRLDRKKGAKFGDDAYAFEELIAELGAAFLCAKIGISAEPREDHAQYLASWLRVLKADKRAIFSAAAKAQAATDYLVSLTEKQAAAA